VREPVLLHSLVELPHRSTVAGVELDRDESGVEIDIDSIHPLNAFHRNMDSVSAWSTVHAEDDVMKEMLVVRTEIIQTGFAFGRGSFP
jgi:hypothetical protein